MSKDIHIINYNQYELFDYNYKTNKVTDWKNRKIFAQIIAESFKRLGDFKSYSEIKQCGTDLVFRLYEDGSKKLHLANFCRHRMCSMCSWRKSLKKYAQVSKMMSWLNDYNYKYIFITLTIKNCSSDDLQKTIDKLFKGYHNLFRQNDIKKAFLGAFRALEITYNYKSKNYHPHIHMIVAVNKSYFNSRYYIKQNKLSYIWQAALSVDYTPIIDVRKINDDDCNIVHAIAEVAKYTVKGSDYIIPYDLDIQDNVIKTLNDVLYSRRLTSVRGVFRDAQRALKINLDDDDLTNTDLDTDMDPQLEYVLVHYKWHFGDSAYLFEDFI